jgi:hypothetical protein
VASALLLCGPGGEPTDRWALDVRDEEVFAAAARELVRFAVDPAAGAIAHERDGELVAGWTADGARRLAQLLPPAYADLAEAILQRHRR